MGDYCPHKKEHVERWREHFLEILNHETIEKEKTGVMTVEEQEDVAISTEPPSRTEIQRAIKQLKNGKAAGMDNITPEALKVDIRQPCDKLISNCKWNGVPFNCCASFDLLESEMGPCYNLNGMTNTKPQPKMISSRATGPGRLSFQISTYSKVFIHSPEDVPYINTWRDEVFEADDQTDIKVIFTIKEIHNERGVSDVSLDRRDCRFPTEDNLWVHPYYSYSACIVQCRSEKEYELCNCTNHLIPNPSYPVCDVKGLICLQNFSNQLQGLRFEWLTNKMGIACSCAASCVEPEYNILKYKTDK
ncbi:sodium channel protein Nach [Anabrus simplex]|uniref:sodium channel protein Nach n=1 Tax=Anabrus simplex TaxID=316456 RepID=UPI0035A34891